MAEKPKLLSLPDSRACYCDTESPSRLAGIAPATFHSSSVCKPYVSFFDAIELDEFNSGRVRHWSPRMDLDLSSGDHCAHQLSWLALPIYLGVSESDSAWWLLERLASVTFLHRPNVSICGNKCHIGAERPSDDPPLVTTEKSPLPKLPEPPILPS